jgi:hypothetical protein
MGRACSSNEDEEEYLWDINGKVRRNETNKKTKT